MRLFPLISVAMRVAVVAQPSMHDSFDDDNFWGDSSDSSSSMLNFEASPTESVKEKSKAGKTGYPGQVIPGSSWKYFLSGRRNVRFIR